MSAWLLVVLWIVGAVVFGFVRGFCQAWWRDRHPMTIELRLREDGSALLSTPHALTRDELRALEAAVARSTRLVLDETARVKGWKFGSGPLPEAER